ncbi:hypothetical protein JCM3765_007740 [Sporobolomyces pararoseus]
MSQITLCFDIVSPWSLFAYKILQRYKNAWGYKLVLKPRFLGGVMVTSGNKPPITVKNKGIWMNKSDMPLFAEMSNIPYNFPETFPINTIHVMRFLRAIEKAQPDKLEKVTDFFWDLVWTRTGGHSAKEAIDPAFFSKKIVASKVLTEEEVKKLIEISQTDEIKEALKSEAADLVNKEGAFGFPWIIVEKEGGKKRHFFGADRFEHIAFYLEKSWDGPRGPGAQRGQSKL